MLADISGGWTGAIAAVASIVVALIAARSARWVTSLTSRVAANETVVDVRSLRFDELKTVNENLRADKAELLSERAAWVLEKHELQRQLEECRHGRRGATKETNR